MEGRRTRAPRRRRKLPIVLVALAALVGILAGAVAARGPLFFMSCDPAGLAEHPIGQTSHVYGAGGNLLITLAAEEQWQPVELAEISPWLQKATIAIEDRRFEEHRGVDYRGLLRALRTNVSSGEATQGGSTITQQLARTLYLSQEKSVSRKLTEACIAVDLERRWEKDRILETYLNRVYFGSRAYGADAAARTYFSKPAAKLTISEAALLAGLPQAPSQLDPLENPDRAEARREQVLQAMLETGAITEQQLAEVRAAPLGLKPSPLFGKQRDAFLANYVSGLVAEEYGEGAVRRGGLKIHTTLDNRLQRLAREAVLRTLDRPGDPAAAVVAIEPGSGAVRAMAAVVPGRDSVAFNLAVDGKRQAGSTFKTFALAEAVEQGINPWGTQFLSAPFTGPDSEGEPWEVKTYDGTYTGRTGLVAATTRSDNTVYARLILDLGPEQVLETASALGITSELPAVPSIVLGSGGVSPLEMTAAYATLANEGRRIPPHLITKVEFPNGAVEEAEEPQEEVALPAAVAFQVTRVLERNVEAGTGVGAQIGRPAAGKTGTTDEYTDAWFSGYTPQLAATVWVGYPERNEPMTDVHGGPVTGGSFPATIWQRFMAPAHEGLETVGFGDPGQPIAWKRFCGRVQFARTIADARPDGGCAETTTAATQRQTTQATQPETEETETVAAPTQPAPPPPPKQQTTAATTTTEAPPEPPPPPADPLEALIGKRGRVVSELPADDGGAEPALGEVQVAGELHFARSEDGAAIPLDAQIEVVAVEEDVLVVRRPRR